MDPIADMMNTLKNATVVHKEVVVVSHSNIKEAIARCLVKEGYLARVDKKVRAGFPVLSLALIEAEKPPFTEVKRISKPSRRMYAGVNEFGGFFRGRGILVLSTPKGIMSHRQAKKELVGGEVLFSLS